MRIGQRFLLPVFLVLGLIILVAASCGGDGEEETSTPDTSPTALPTQTSVSPTTAPTSRPSLTSTPIPPESPSPVSPPRPLPSLETFVSFTHGVGLSSPKGWVTDESQPELLTIENPTGLASIEVRLDTFSAPLSPAQFDEYASLKLLQLKGEHQGFQEIDRELVADPPGLMMRFSYEEQNRPMFGVVLYTFNNLRGARAMAITSADFSEFFDELFEESLKSIQLQPVAPGPTPSPAPTPTTAPTPVPTVTPGTYTDQELGFTLQVPSGWGTLERIKDEAVRFIGPGGFVVQVFSVQVPASMSGAAYVEVLKESRYQPLSGYEFVSEGQRTIGVQPVREVQFDASEGSNGITNRHLSTVMRLGTQIYVIEAIGPRAEFNGAESGVRALIDSFRP